MPTHKSRANIYKTNKESLLMSVRFTTVSLSLSNSLPFYSHLLACLPDRLAFHTGEMIPKACIHAYTETHTHRQTRRHTDRLLHLQILTLTFIYTHRLHFCWFWRYDTHLVTVTSFPCPCLSLQLSPVPCALCLPLPPARNHCCHFPFAQQLLRDNLCPHSPQTFPFVVCANPCADKSA